MTAPPFDEKTQDCEEICNLLYNLLKVHSYINPQTVHFCNLLGIKNNINPDGEVVLYGDPTRKPKSKYINWNTPEYIPKGIHTEKSLIDEDDGFV